MAEIDYLINTPNKGDLPPPLLYVQLYVSQCTRDEKGRILLTCELASDGEIDEYVDRLIKQLNGVRRKAKRSLSKAKENEQRRLREL